MKNRGKYIHPADSAINIFGRNLPFCSFLPPQKAWHFSFIVRVDELLLVIGKSVLYAMPRFQSQKP